MLYLRSFIKKFSTVGKTIVQALVLGLFGLASAPLMAATIANFTVTSINGGGFIDDEEPPLSGDPDRYFSMAIFDFPLASIFNSCARSCSADDQPDTFDGENLVFPQPNTGTGIWNFPDQTLSKVVPDTGEAYFYFGLWDEDFDADDSLGDHWFFAGSAVSGTVLNNNLSPYRADNPIVTVAGRDVEGRGSARNYFLTYEVSFEDTTPVSAIPVPAAVWLFGTALIGLIGFGKRRKAA